MMTHEEIQNKAIQNKAYFLWEQAGRPEGRSNEFWNQAKTEVVDDISNIIYRRYEDVIYGDLITAEFDQVIIDDLRTYNDNGFRTPESSWIYPEAIYSGDPFSIGCGTLTTQQKPISNWRKEGF